MSTTQQYLDYSLLSFAAYAKDLTPLGAESNIDNYVDENFTQTQAESFITSGWEVVSQSSDALYGSSTVGRISLRNPPDENLTWYSQAFLNPPTTDNAALIRPTKSIKHHAGLSS